MRFERLSIATVLALTILPLASEPTVAQEVRLVGGDELATVRAARQVVERGTYLILQSDTVLPEGFRTEGDIVVLDADVRLAGQVRGDVVLVRGALFIRPEARIGGSVHALGGLVVVSGLAEPVEVGEAPLATRVEIERIGGVHEVRIHAPPPEPMFALPGLYGLNPLALRYDRVDGLSLPFEVDWFPTRNEGRLRVIAGVTYRSARGALDPHVESELLIGRWLLQAEVARRTRTSDAWASGDLSNSASALLLGNDYRNYHQSDVASVGARHREGWPVGAAGLILVPAVEIEVTRDRSLSASSPWSLFGTLDRPNPPIEDGSVTSFRPAVDIRWAGASVQLDAGVSAEVGRISPEDEEADRTFGYLITDGRWRMDALFDHTLHVRHHFRRPLGSDRVPAQRRSLLGGTPTIPTLPIGEMLGDHLDFIRTRYEIPAPVVTLPVVGTPVLRLHHAAGAAWDHGQPRPGWEQSLGLGVRLLFVTIDGWVDPADSSRRMLSFGFASPF